MSQSGVMRMAVTFMLLGSALTLAVVGLGYAVYHYSTRAPTEPHGALVPESVNPPAATEPAELASTKTPGGETRPGHVAPTSAPQAPAEKVKPEPVVAVAQDSDKGTGEAAEVRAAPEAAAAVEDAQKALELERQHLRRKFEERKAQFMGIIDTYMALPVEDRPDYLQKAMEEWRQQAEAERVAEGLPARPRNQGLVMREMMGMARENLTEEEKKKVGVFMGDVMQMQMARVQAEFERQLHTPPATPPAPDTPPSP